MTTDLRALLRDAETVEQRCDAVARFVDRMNRSAATDWAEKHAIDAAIAAVVLGRSPGYLLGVVAAMVPPGRLWSIGSSADHTGFVAVMDRSGISHKAHCPACALALAILDAMEGGNG